MQSLKLELFLVGAISEGGAGFYLKAVILVMAVCAITGGLALMVGAGNQHDHHGKFRGRGFLLFVVGLVVGIILALAVVFDRTE